MSEIYYDKKSDQKIKLIEVNDKKRYLIIEPLNNGVGLKLEFAKGFLASDYIKKYFEKMNNHHMSEGDRDEDKRIN